MKSIIYSIILTLLISCNKDTLDTIDNTVTEKLTGKNWILRQMGEDTNGNGSPDDIGPGTNELKYTDSSVSFIFMLNSGGTGHITFASPDTSLSTDITWTLDSGETYITSVVPALNRTVVSKIINLTNSSITGVIDTSVTPKQFVYFVREGFN